MFFSGDATEIKLRDLKPSADYFVKYVNPITDTWFSFHCILTPKIQTLKVTGKSSFM